jgi:sodium/bile acid cotransporter 7
VRKLGFTRKNQITIIFCGSKKSLAAGLSMATVLFGAQARLMVLPLMLFHQMQLMVCAVIAKRWHNQPPPPSHRPTPGGRPRPGS